MHLGTSTTILLAFSLFGNLCGSQKPPEAPRESTPDNSEKIREAFTKIHEQFIDRFAEQMATIVMGEARFQDKDKELTAEAKATAMYPILVKQHEKLVARTEALQAEREAHVAFFEANKQDPDEADLKKQDHDERATNHGAYNLITDYDALNSKMQKLVYEAR